MVVPARRRSAVARRCAIAGAAGLVLLYAWGATSVQAFTWPQRIMTGAAGVAVLAVAAHSTARRVPLSRWWTTWRMAVRRDADPYSGPGHVRLRWRAGAVVWGTLIVAILASELFELFSSPRSVHPTLSAIVDPVLRRHWLRLLAYLLWIALGFELARE